MMTSKKSKDFTTLLASRLPETVPLVFGEAEGQIPATIIFQFSGDAPKDEATAVEYPVTIDFSTIAAMLRVKDHLPRTLKAGRPLLALSELGYIADFAFSSVTKAAQVEAKDILSANPKPLAPVVPQTTSHWATLALAGLCRDLPFLASVADEYQSEFYSALADPASHAMRMNIDTQAYQRAVIYLAQRCGDVGDWLQVKNPTRFIDPKAPPVGQDVHILEWASKTLNAAGEVELIKGQLGAIGHFDESNFYNAADDDGAFVNSVKDYADEVAQFAKDQKCQDRLRAVAGVPMVFPLTSDVVIDECSTTVRLSDFLAEGASNKSEGLPPNIAMTAKFDFLDFSPDSIASAVEDQYCNANIISLDGSVPESLIEDTFDDAGSAICHYRYEGDSLVECLKKHNHLFREAVSHYAKQNDLDFGDLDNITPQDDDDKVMVVVQMSLKEIWPELSVTLLDWSARVAVYSAATRVPERVVITSDPDILTLEQLHHDFINRAVAQAHEAISAWPGADASNHAGLTGRQAYPELVRQAIQANINHAIAMDGRQRVVSNAITDTTQAAPEWLGYAKLGMFAPAKKKAPQPAPGAEQVTLNFTTNSPSIR